MWSHALTWSRWNLCCEVIHSCSLLMSLMIKQHQSGYSPAFCCLPILPLLLKSTLEGATGIRKSKIWSVFQMGSENVLDFVHVYQHFQLSELCWEEWKKLSLVSCTKWSQSGTGKVHGQIPFCLNSREANEQAKLQSFDLRMSLASIKNCLKFLLFSSALLLPFAFLCCVVNVSCPDFAIGALCLKATLTQWMSLLNYISEFFQGVCSLERQSCLQSFQFQKCCVLEPIRFPWSWWAKTILNLIISVSWKEE